MFLQCSHFLREFCFEELRQRSRTGGMVRCPVCKHLPHERASYIDTDASQLGVPSLSLRSDTVLVELDPLSLEPQLVVSML